MGPAWYFSPERRRGEGFDSLDDVWAAGCMMAEMIVSWWFIWHSDQNTISILDLGGGG